MNAKQLANRLARIAWLRKNYPSLQACNPYEDHALLNEAEWGLISHSGLVDKTNRALNMTNLILELQNKNPRERRYHHRVARSKNYFAQGKGERL